MAKPISLAFILLLVLGLGLMVLGFFFLVPTGQRGPIAWLNLAVFAVIFLMNASNLGGRGDGDFSRKIPTLGILMIANLVYSGLALGGMLVGRGGHFSFQAQLMYQLSVLFCLVLLVTLAGRASEHVGNVAIDQKQISGSLDRVRSAIRKCDSTFTLVSAATSRDYLEFQRIKEQARFLSPSESPEAVSLDLEIARLIDAVSASLTMNGYPDGGQEMTEALARCQTLLHLRKQKRQS